MSGRSMDLRPDSVRRRVESAREKSHLRNMSVVAGLLLTVAWSTGAWRLSDARAAYSPRRRSASSKNWLGSRSDSTKPVKHSQRGADVRFPSAHRQSSLRSSMTCRNREQSNVSSWMRDLWYRLRFEEQDLGPKKPRQDESPRRSRASPLPMTMSPSSWKHFGADLCSRRFEWRRPVTERLVRRLLAPFESHSTSISRSPVRFSSQQPTRRLMNES
jgi:hypothetical protein